MNSPELTVIPLHSGRSLQLREYLPGTGAFLWQLTDAEGERVRWLNEYEDHFIKCAVTASVNFSVDLSDITLELEDHLAIKKSMPGGQRGFLPSWGLAHYAKAVEKIILGKVKDRLASRATPLPVLSAMMPVTEEENERFSQDVSNFKGADPEATMYALEQFLERRASPPPQRRVTKFNPADNSPETSLQMAAVIALRDEQPAVDPVNIDQIAVERYKVVPAHESMFHRWAVVAGDGMQQLYLGREVDCQNMARKFAGAFLDGAYLASPPARPDAPPVLFNPYTGERRDSRDVESDPYGTLIIESFRDIPAASEGQS